jgi:hypothetical protein
VTVIGDSIVVLSLIAKSVSLVNTRGLGLAVGEIVGEIVGEGDGDPVPVLAVTTSASRRLSRWSRRGRPR